MEKSKFESLISLVIRTRTNSKREGEREVCVLTNFAKLEMNKSRYVRAKSLESERPEPFYAPSDPIFELQSTGFPPCFLELVAIVPIPFPDLAFPETVAVLRIVFPVRMHDGGFGIPRHRKLL